MRCADDPRRRLETQLPAPQNDEAPAARWRWMENRWLVLVVTVIVASVSVTLIHDMRVMKQVKAAIEMISSWKAALGLNAPFWVLEEGAVSACATFWCYPFALRLGALRSAIWLLLAGVAGGSASWSVIGDSAFWKVTLLLAAPGLAMIGRRTRPWMILPASAAYLSVTTAHWELNDLLSEVTKGLPFAAILIFGTDLISKKPATAAATG
jgi:hypothetical protein